MQYIRLLLFFSVIFQSCNFQSCKFSYPPHPAVANAVECAIITRAESKLNGRSSITQNWRP